MSQLVYKVCYTIYQGSIYLWQIGPVPIHCKVPKHFGKDCLKIFASALLTMIQISEKSDHLAKKC